MRQVRFLKRGIASIDRLRNFLIFKILSLNYVSIIISSVFYFVLGAFWYCPLLGTMRNSFFMLPGTVRCKELQKMNIVINDLTNSQALYKIIITFCATFFASLAMACLVNMVNSTTIYSGFFLGSLIAIGFATVTLAISYTWENRSFKLFMIDSLCPIIGIITSAIILSMWR